MTRRLAQVGCARLLLGGVAFCALLPRARLSTCGAALCGAIRPTPRLSSQLPRQIATQESSATVPYQSATVVQTKRKIRIPADLTDKELALALAVAKVSRVLQKGAPFAIGGAVGGFLGWKAFLSLGVVTVPRKFAFSALLKFKCGLAWKILTKKSIGAATAKSVCGTLAFGKVLWFVSMGAGVGILVPIVVKGVRRLYLHKISGGGDEEEVVATGLPWSSEPCAPLTMDSLEKEVLRRRPEVRKEIAAELESLSLVVREGLHDVTDVTPVGDWPVCNFANTISELEKDLGEGQHLAFHYTNEKSVLAIAKEGIRSSESGPGGGGIFFSLASPLAELDGKEKDQCRFKDCWRSFRPRQLRANYGEHLTDSNDRKRTDKVDYCIAVKIADDLVQKGGDRPGAVFVSKSIYPKFPQENVLRIFRLKP